MAALILLVHTNTVTLDRLDNSLSRAGYVIAAESSFLRARGFLESATPNLLVADIRLGEFNGVHLAIWTRSERPDLPVVLMHPSQDSVLERETIRQGAVFVVVDVQTPDALLRCVRSVLDRHRGAVRRWPR